MYFEFSVPRTMTASMPLRSIIACRRCSLKMIGLRFIGFTPGVKVGLGKRSLHFAHVLFGKPVSTFPEHSLFSADTGRPDDRGPFAGLIAQELAEVFRRAAAGLERLRLESTDHTHRIQPAREL